MSTRNDQSCAAGECYEADVAIVGAGIAGATIAYKLASPTCRVLLLDAGPRIDRVTAVNRFKAAHCGASSTVGFLRGLLANASSQAQPAGWAASWAARASEVAASAQSEALAA